MSKSGNKGKSPIILFGLGFVVVVFVALIVNWRSAFVRSVSFPLNGGGAHLSTVTDRLAAVCRDDKVYVWDWNRL